MNPLLQQALGSIFRWGLALVVPFFVSNGIWTPEESTAYVTAAAAALVALAWGLWQKYSSRVQFLNALDARPGTPEDQVKAAPAPPMRNLIRLFVVVMLSGYVAACGARGAQISSSAEDAFHDGLIAFDNAFDARCDSNALEPATCKSLNQVLVPVWDVKNEINRDLRNGFTLSDLPQKVERFRAALDALVAEVRRMVQGEALRILLDELNLARSQVVAQ